jgi:hypothetical protein
MRNHREKSGAGGYDRPHSAKIRTTLYELIETVIDVVGTDKNQVIMSVLLDTLREGRANVRVSGTLTN